MKKNITKYIAKNIIANNEHGGTDRLGVPRWDFSSNANAVAIKTLPPKKLISKILNTPINFYPDPNYINLKQKLAQWHKVAPWQILIAGSGSEFINRLTTVIAHNNPQAKVYVPASAYGDYAKAAIINNLEVVEINNHNIHKTKKDDLIWHAEPSSPYGQLSAAPEIACGLLIIDRVYSPLILEGKIHPTPPNAWELHSPNKALGLLAIRGAYVIAPDNDSVKVLVGKINDASPSWVIGAQAVTMLECWVEFNTQKWLSKCKLILTNWKKQQIKQLQKLGWQCLESVTPFFLVSWKGSVNPARRKTILAQLRNKNIKLRDAKGLGAEGYIRVSVQHPRAQKQLIKVWQKLHNQK